MSVNLEELIGEVTGNVVPSLLVGIATAVDCAPFGGYGGHSSCFHATSSVVGILVLPSDALGIGFPVPRGAIIADHEKLPRETSGR